MNANAKIHKTKNAEINLEHILNLKAFDLDAKVELNPQFLEEEYPFEWMGIYNFTDAEHQMQMSEGPDPSFDIGFIKLNNISENEIVKAKKQAIKLFAEVPKEIKNEKFANANNSLNRLLINDTNQTFYFRPNKPGYYAVFTQHGPEEFSLKIKSEHKVNEKEFSNTKPQANLSQEDLQHLKYDRLFTLSAIRSEKFAHSHEHDDTVSSVGIADESALSIQKVNEWISFLLQNRGTDIYRMKGILNIAGNNERFVFQGVHMLFDAKADREWHPGEKRRNQIIFIGKNLNREELIAGYKRCISKTTVNA
ncbi:MAG: GTP-binding protein [Sphingobacteriaceae bacterium]